MARLRTFALLLHRPSLVGRVLRDLFRRPFRVEKDDNHLEAAMRWLCSAQDVTGCGGVSAGWWLKYGWKPPYPETTGYLIPTFLRYASLHGDQTFLRRARQMGDWELTIQYPSGSIPGGVGTYGEPLVFDTGQVIQGWNALFRETGQKKYLDAAVRAARWIIEHQEEDGSWGTYSHHRKPHTYYTRVAWPLFELSQLTGDETFGQAAEQYVAWVLSKVGEDCWIEEMGFTAGPPLTHTVAYTYEGLLECAAYLAEDLQAVVLEIATKAMKNLLLSYERGEDFSGRHSTRPLPAIVDRQWQFKSRFSCLVGNAQLAILWLRMYEASREMRFLNVALSIINHLKSTQSLNDRDPDIRGAISGSLPIWGGYGSFAFPNWAGKFFADALMLKLSIAKNLADKNP